MSCEIICLDTISSVPAEQWDALTDENPLLSHAYLAALETTDCATPQTGWAPRHLILLRNGAVRAAMPLYAKTHSRGEYVFDQAWAQAYARHGLDYYPKLVGAVPFTPVPGRRLLAIDRNDQHLLMAAALQLANEHQYSSLHILFPPEDELPVLQEAGLKLRRNVQFHWVNQGYQGMDDFLAALQQQKRKKLRQDRRRVADAGIAFRWFSGHEIDSATLRFLYLCYVQTYLEHGNAPYLTPAFFERIHDRLAGSLVIVQAHRRGVPVAAALNVRHGDRLYGRYWGCMETVPGLHFETCYTQGIEYCIAHGIRVFEGGAQGEHKLARGMLPVRTHSAHWVKDPVFSPAVADFLEREGPYVERYMEQLQEHSPYRDRPAQVQSGDPTSLEPSDALPAGRAGT